MPTYKKTATVAEELEISSANIQAILKSHKMPPPPKDASGDFLWSEAAIEALKQARTIDFRRKEHKQASKERWEKVREKAKNPRKELPPEPILVFQTTDDPTLESDPMIVEPASNAVDWAMEELPEQSPCPHDFVV